MRARGLKRAMRGNMTRCQVAPRAGAWIETRHAWKYDEMSMSRPVRARGLKRAYILCALTTA